jgi:hypothetical protein
VRTPIAAVLAAGVVLTAHGRITLRATQGPEGTAVVRGRVVDAVTGKPLRNIPIRFSPEHRTPFTPGIDTSLPGRTAITDANGAFEVTALAAGEYSIYGGGSLGDYLDVSYGIRGPGGGSRSLAVLEGARIDITLDAWPGASIGGRVIDEGGRPVVGANMSLASTNGGSYGSATTDDRGEYLIARLRPGDYTVGVPITLASRTLNAAPPARSPSSYRPPLLPYLLDRSARAILTTYGAPLPPSSADGSPNLYVTTYYGGAGFADAKYFSLAVGQARSGVDIVLRDAPGLRVSGTAVGPSGPVTGIVLTLGADGVAESYVNGRITATAAADGSFVFVAAPPGTYRLSASRRVPPPTEIVLVEGAPSMPMDDVIGRDDLALWADMPLTIGSEDMNGVQVVLHAGTSISGRVVFDDQSPIDLRSRLGLSLARIDSQSSIADTYVQVAPDGTFMVRAKPGQYLIEAQGSVEGRSFQTARVDGREIGDGPIVVGDSAMADLEVVFARGATSVRGGISDSRGNAFSDATIVIFPVDRTRWERRTESNRTRLVRLTAASYEVTGLMPGDYFIAAVDERVQPASLGKGAFERLSAFASRVQFRTGVPMTLNLLARTDKTP